MAVKFKVLCLYVLPLLFISGNAQVVQDSPSNADIQNQPVDAAAGAANPQKDITAQPQGQPADAAAVASDPPKDRTPQNQPADTPANPQTHDRIAKDAETNFKGKWELVSDNSGVSAMHAILLPKINKVLMYDATIWRISRFPLPPEKRPCHMVDPVKKIEDCWCHSVLFDVESYTLKALKIETDTWCSSGGLTVDGNLVGTGGYMTGANTVRFLDSCALCDWREYPAALADPRWYATQITLPDGRFIIFGGRETFSYEYIPAEGKTNQKSIFFPFLRDTSDNLQGDIGPQKNFRLENNLYPFVHLVPDGSVFVFANNRSILFNPDTNKVIRELPVLTGGARNYPASGMSVLLPLRLFANNLPVKSAEVLICGGAQWDAFFYAEVKKQFLPALRDCGRIQLMKPKAVWKKEIMPSGRVMGDMMILPTGDILMVNGAQTGTSAWNDAEEPNFTPVLYKTRAKRGYRFEVLAAGTIPRMYHSVAVVLPDTKVLIAGSNTNNGYLTDVKYPTELRVEKFSPPYLDPALAELKPEIIFDKTDKVITYGKAFTVTVASKEATLNKIDVKVTMYAPAFTTHGISMNQRLLMLGVIDVTNNVSPGVHSISTMSPPYGAAAPPGYYILYAICKGVPGAGMWIQIK